MRMYFDVTDDGMRFISNNNRDMNDIYPYCWLGFSTGDPLALAENTKLPFRLRNWDAI